ncbi:MAG: hypothetical protein QOC95_2033, partial [Thermoleophilaceae bacterium]|nr:hypothetical protein [Thermoleophilaceae bacterium]
EDHQRGADSVEWEESPPRRPSRAGDTLPLGEPRPRVGPSDAPTEVGRRGRRPRRRAQPDEADTEPLGEPRPGPGDTQQLPLAPEPPPGTPSEPLPPPEFRLPGKDDPEPG